MFKFLRENIVYVCNKKETSKKSRSLYPLLLGNLKQPSPKVSMFMHCYGLMETDVLVFVQYIPYR
jgi:hypothetical protein